MKLSRSELLSALEAIKGAVPDKNIVPILTHVLISNEYVMGYDSEIGIRVKLSTPVGAMFNIKFAPFYSLLRALEDEDLELELTDRKVKIRCGTHRSTMEQSVESYPKPAIKVPPEDWHEAPAGLKEAIERCLVGASQDENNKALSAVCISGDHVYGSDGKRGIRCTLAGMDARPVLIPRKAAAELVKLGSPKRFAVSESFALFDFLNVTFLGRLREGKFPTEGLDHIMSKQQTKELVPPGLNSALERLLIFSDKEADASVELSNDSEGLHLRARHDTSSAEEILPTSEHVKAAKAFGPRLLMDGLTFADSINWGDGAQDPIYLKGEVSSFEYLLMPRLSTP